VLHFATICEYSITLGIYILLTYGIIGCKFAVMPILAVEYMLCGYSKIKKGGVS
jgi:hypothetical protein